ncbi:MULTISPECIES: nitrogen fixation protein NifQ [Cupriavidus]
MNQSLLILDAFSLSPGEPAARTLAGVLERADAGGLPRFAQWLGLDEAEFWRMLEQCFPGARAAGWAPESAPVDAAALPCEFPDLVAMLVASGDASRPAMRWAAHALACGCFGGSHLWQDMGLSGRHDVSRLLREYFPALHAANTTDMKWKKFLYHELCRRLDLHPCPEPRCTGCDNYAACHGAETVVMLGH